MIRLNFGTEGGLAMSGTMQRRRERRCLFSSLSIVAMKEKSTLRARRQRENAQG